ncbi:efflux RND transporter permease subunit [Aromatoleum bremense]|uniref:Efflux pump membrane transporter n=1 Tax=Aromatoleum bremense TaxID=76115 RepID=A0ABX1NZI8_9RHOO|nr:efflux RND transporter permease subunit [Aromatoleum bremense]NMG17193.1 efflux RND transporter permease subunit [Aromatoleum bremense]QTQ30541.1 RND transporter, hydrophobe/amphiphile efflux-1 (HAE) family [Aromatoleum bremense]
MSRFFIDRPIFAWVLAIVVMLAGTLSILKLPINQYPNVAPPAVSISVVYPGASAQTVQDTVVQVIEQQLNGLDGLRYLSSASNSDGSMEIIVTFEQGTDPDIAQVQVQNKLQLATPMLPQEVQQQGIRVAKYQMNFMLVVGLVSEDGSMSYFDLSDYIVSHLQDPISRTQGVGDFMVFGAPNAMRIWLDPAKLNSYQLTPSDILAAVRAQNVQVSAGQLGGLPTRDNVQLTATVLGKTRMTTPAEFENILLKVEKNGAQVRLKDVAEVGLGAQNFSISGNYNGKPASGMALRLATGANVLETIDNVRATLATLEPYFPAGMKAVYPYDTSPVVTASIESVVKTLIEAIVLVFLVMYLFLQNFRATLVPTLAVPVVLLGTFAVLLAAGFTINILTMFAMVLAIGLLVDDAIVVVENVERIMHEEGLSAKEATKKSMDQITGALIGIGLVISAVFVPMAFLGGSTGVIYRQFSITIATAMTLSVLVAIMFTPALCATILRRTDVDHSEQNRFFRWFNRRFNASSESYGRGVAGILKRKKRFLVLYGVLLLVLGALFMRLPTAFLPDEDQGLLLVQVQLPPNASVQRTQAVLAEVRDYLLQDEAEHVASVLTVDGFNFAGRGQNSGIAFVELKPFAERTSPASAVQALAGRAFGRFMAIKDATVIPIVPPSILELGNATGFDLYLQDKAGVGHEALMAARNQLLGMASQDPGLRLVRPNGLSDEPQYQVVIDDEKARAQQVSLAAINETLSVAWGSAYVNDFVDRGRVKKVFVQGAVDARIAPEDFDKWYVRNAEGKMVPFSAFASGHWTYGSPKLERYNGLPAVQILGQAAPGSSSGDAMATVERLAQQLPPGVDLAFTGLSFEERLAGAQSSFTLVLSLVVVFLCLAALYESWSIPFSVILVVPVGILGAVMATLGRGLSNDVFFQIGMITTMGLAAKNAILIVEFARELHEKEGRRLFDAAVLAARMRLRPIIMTSLAFVMGVIPLAIATGASSGSQHSIGTSVVGGTLAGTFLAIFFVPLFFYVVASAFKKKTPTEAVAVPQAVEVK